VSQIRADDAPAQQRDASQKQDETQHHRETSRGLFREEDGRKDLQHDGRKGKAHRATTGSGRVLIACGRCNRTTGHRPQLRDRNVFNQRDHAEGKSNGTWDDGLRRRCPVITQHPILLVVLSSRAVEPNFEAEMTCLSGRPWEIPSGYYTLVRSRPCGLCRHVRLPVFPMATA